MECDYCKKTLSTLGNLKYHKKTNKLCIKIQADNNLISEKIITCEFCNKIFTSIKTLKVHLNICKIKIKNDKEKEEQNYEIKKLINNLEKKDIEIEKLKNEIEKLKNENKMVELKTKNKIYAKDRELIHKIASSRNTTNINVINNIFNQPEKVKELLEHNLNTNHIVDGQKGIAHFAFNTLLKDDNGNINYFCTDLSRSIFKFQNSEGELEKDFKATRLTDLIVSSGLKNKTVNIANNLWTNEDGTFNLENFKIFNPQANEIIMIESDNSVFRNELACLTAI